MLGKSHLFYGVTAGAALALALLHPHDGIPYLEAALAGGAGGLLPDLDEPGSTISNTPRILGRAARRQVRSATRRTPLSMAGAVVGMLIGVAAAILNAVSRLLSRVVRFVSGGHREGTHWLPIWAGLSIGVYLLTAAPLGPWIAIGFSAGYLSHLVGDGCTRSGIPLVPYTAARLHLLPRPIRIRTGSAGETLFTLLYAGAVAAFVATYVRL